jgi:acyl dehydratase
MDAAFARTTPFGERIAHGPLAMSSAIGLLTQTGLLGERVIALVNLNWDFSGPVRIGDTIRAKVTVEEVRPTSREGRNLVTFLLNVANQRGESVQTGRMRVVVKADLS